MRELLGLRAGEGRADVDAFFDFSSKGLRYATPIELKSTTVGSVSTGRDIGPDHLTKWRERIWVIAFYGASGEDIERLLVLAPADMDDWISRIEGYIRPDFAIADRASQRLSSLDMQVVCGEKSSYTLEDARRLFKRQWQKRRYLAEMDLQDGYSTAKMLEIFRLRTQYLIGRGATLNNPHIPKGYLARFGERLVDAQAWPRGESAARRRREFRVQLRKITLADPSLAQVARRFAQGRLGR